MTWPGHGVLLLPVPPLETWIRARTAHYDASFLSADARFSHAHLTIFAPMPPARRDVGETLAASMAPFDILLERFAVFPDGIIHLVPAANPQLEWLLSQARALLPEVAPYWGRTPLPGPHVTLDAVSEDVSVRQVAQAIGPLPIPVRVEELHLSWWQSGNCHTIETIAFTG